MWWVAGNLQKPVDILCRHTKKIGRGELSPLQEPFSVGELEELRVAVNEMEKRLEESKETQQQFFQNISHDLRTPLMSICGYAQGISTGVFPDDKKAAGIIAEESIRLKNLVDGILTLTRLNDTHYKTQPVKICVNDFIEEHLERLTGMRQIKQIRVVFENPNEEVWTVADGVLLSAAFGNILSNGIQYGKSQVKVSLYIKEGRSVIEIADDGCGIAQEDLPHVFERFYKGKKGSFGIGLSIAAAAMKRMDGCVSVKSSKQGAVFFLSLPSV